MAKGTNIQVVFALGQVLPAVVDNFSFSLSWTRGPNKVGYLWSAHTLLCGHVIIFSYCILSMLFANVLESVSHLGCDNHQFFLKRFLWVGISCEGSSIGSILTWHQSGEPKPTLNSPKVNFYYVALQRSFMVD